MLVSSIHFISSLRDFSLLSPIFIERILGKFLKFFVPAPEPLVIVFIITESLKYAKLPIIEIPVGVIVSMLEELLIYLTGTFNFSTIFFVAGARVSCIPWLVFIKPGTTGIGEQYILSIPKISIPTVSYTHLTLPTTPYV